MTRENLPGLYSWENCPEAIKNKVKNILVFLRDITGDNLSGFYLHGSLAMGCFSPKTSDIDLLAIINRHLSVPQKKKIIFYLQNIDKKPPTLEISIVTEDSLKNPVYPSPFELHYSSRTKDTYTSGKVSWEEQRADTDLPTHFMAIRERGILLYGKPFKEILPEIPREIFIASIVQDLHWIRQEITTLPFTYTVLNPCRALAYIKEDKFMSKKEGGEWALQQLPQQYTTLLEKALAAYSGTENIVPPSQDTLSEFIDYAIKEFIYLAAKTDAEQLFFRRSY